jgi:hypothetical protein
MKLSWFGLLFLLVTLHRSIATKRLSRREKISILLIVQHSLSRAALVVCKCGIQVTVIYFDKSRLP